MRRRHGYTLLETLIALIIFALVSAATGFALSAAIRGQDAVQKRADEMQEARAVLSTLSKDIRAAYASAGNTNTFFVASGAETGVILTFTTLNHRIDLGQTVTAGAADNTVTMPQSDVAVVQYSYDPERRELDRSELTVPNPDAIPQPGNPGTVLSRRIRSIQFQFMSDPTAGTRSDWNYVTQAQQTGTQQGAQQQSSSGDTTLPTSVQVTIEFADANGMPKVYNSVISVMAPTPQPAGQKPDPPPTTAGTGGGAGGGGAG